MTDVHWLAELAIPQVDELHLYGTGESLPAAPVKSPAIGINYAPLRRPDIPFDYWIFCDQIIAEAVPDWYCGVVICRVGLEQLPALTPHVCYSYRYTLGPSARPQHTSNLPFIVDSMSSALGLAALFRPRVLHLWGCDFVSCRGRPRWMALEFLQITQDEGRILRLRSAIECLQIAQEEGHIQSARWHVADPTRPELAGAPVCQIDAL